jgi:hypothetical protein
LTLARLAAVAPQTRKRGGRHRPRHHGANVAQLAQGVDTFNHRTIVVALRHSYRKPEVSYDRQSILSLAKIIDKVLGGLYYENACRSLDTSIDMLHQQR